jgi:hypothetical protein
MLPEATWFVCVSSMSRAGPGMSSDEVFRQMKEIQALATTVTDEVTKLADKKKAEIEAA